MAYEIRPEWLAPSRATERFIDGRCLSPCLLAGRVAWETVVKTLIAKSLFAAAALVTVLGCKVPAAHAASTGGWRNEPWCAFFEYDDVTVDCSYRTFAECYPNVIGGIRGTCGPNPDGPGTPAPASAAAHRHKKQRAQQ
jgi:hypothetical protein